MLPGQEDPYTGVRSSSHIFSSLTIPDGRTEKYNIPAFILPNPANTQCNRLNYSAKHILLGHMTDELLHAKNTLTERIEYWTGTKGNAKDAIPGMWMYKYEAPSARTRIIQRPSICLIGQGSKEVLLGKDSLVYDRDHYLVTSLDLPVVAQIRDASPERPYMGLAFTLEQKEVAKLLAEGSLPIPTKRTTQRAMSVGQLSLSLIDAFLRLINLLEEPVSIPFLAPSIKREILYRLITSDQGYHVRQLSMSGSQSSQIHGAVQWLKDNYNKPVKMEELAELCHMSLSSFHHHFHNLTAMSPLQYQKWFRLQEARRLMLVDDLDVTRAAFEVGYESSSQFCREYSRQFGNSPAKDIRLLKQSGPMDA